MKTSLECIPCFFKHALASAKIAGVSKKQQRYVLNELARFIPSLSLSASPPETARLVNHLISRITKNPDVYKKIKKNSIIKVLSMYQGLQKKILHADDQLLMAIELAIAGNVIDYGVHTTDWIESELTRIMRAEKKVIYKGTKKSFNYPAFQHALKESRTIVYLSDNAGETVFDRLLLETIHQVSIVPKEIVYVVKEKPAINDALVEDAMASGIDTVAHIISSGSDAPGTVLTLCSGEFKKIFEQAEMVISKGQGNFEALSAVKRDIFFLLMVKCPVIANDLSAHVGTCHVGDTILFQHVCA